MIDFHILHGPIYRIKSSVLHKPKFFEKNHSKHQVLPLINRSTYTTGVLDKSVFY